MATTIVTKYGSDAPAASDIVRGELAVDTENGRLYTENAAGAVVEIGLKPEANVDVTGTITATGTSVFTNLDISGDIDVDGTTNLDVVDIDGAVDFASTTAHAGDATFADNAKAIFGAGSDLQIYHDGSNSYIDDSGTNRLYIRGSRITFDKYTGETMADMVPDGAVNLFYNNANVFQTTATGINTGSVTADAAKIENSTTSTVTISESTGSGTAELRFVATESFPKTKIVTDVSAGSLSLETLGNERLNIANNGDISFYEDTGTTAKLFWDASAESLGIGNTSPSSVLGISSGAGDAYITQTNSQSAQTLRMGNAYSIFGTSLGSYSAIDSDSTLLLGTGGSERIRIDSSGNVGIGLIPFGWSSYKNVGVSGSGALYGTGAGSTLSGHSHGCYYDGTNWKYSYTGAGATRYEAVGATSPYQAWYTANSGTADANITFSEAMRIDADGKLLVGTTHNSLYNSSTQAHAGVLLDGLNDNLQVARWESTPLFLNRMSTDGDLVQFRKDGATVGGISSIAGQDIVIGSGSAGLRFLSSGPAIQPRNSTGDANNDAIDIGLSGNRFKDLYLSGGAYLGGTAAANKLDDYESGTWTPTFNSASFTATGVTSVSGAYVKIGDFVQVSFIISFTGTSGNFAEGDTASIGGLPFNPVTYNGGGTANASQDYLGNVRMAWQTLQPLALVTFLWLFILVLEQSVVQLAYMVWQRI